MTARDYLLGCALVAASFGPLVLGAFRLRARLVPAFSAAHARVAEAVLVFAGFTLVSHVLGAVGAFRRWPVVLGMAVLGFAVALTSGKPPMQAERLPVVDPPVPRKDVILAVVITALVVAFWTPSFLNAIRSGPTEIDSQTFHLPMAARFVQDGWLTRLNFLFADFHYTYYPYDGDLVHAFGFLTFGRDVLTLVINHAWMALALLAGWAFGRRDGVQAATLAGVAAVLVLPGVLLTQPGAATTDIAGLFCILAAAAFLMKDHESTGSIVVAGLAAGLALGIKQSFVVPVAGLTLLALWLSMRRSGRRLRGSAAWLVPLILAGGFWYLRNLALVGTPVPGLDLRIGPIDLSGPPMRLLDEVSDTFIEQMRAGVIWDFLRPGLRLIFGSLWPLLLLPFFGLAAALLLTKDRVVRGLGFVGILTAVGYVFTPTSGGGIRPGEVDLFAPTLRYVFPTVALGLMLLVVVIGRRYNSARRWLSAGMGVLVVLIYGSGWTRLSTSALATGILVLVAALFVWLASRAPRPALVVGSVVAAVAMLGVGFVAQRYYSQRRYTPMGAYANQWGPLSEVIFRAGELKDVSVGVTGHSLQYPFFGPSLENTVRYVGDERPDGEFTDYRTCESWRLAVNRGDYDYLFFMPHWPNFDSPPLERWTRSEPAADLIDRSGGVSLYRVRGSLRPEAC